MMAKMTQPWKTEGLWVRPAFKTAFISSFQLQRSNDYPFFFFLQHLSEVDQNCLPRQQKNERTGLDNILLLDTWVTANGLQLLRELNTSALVLLKVSVNHILAYWQCMCYILAAHRIIMDHYFREGKYSNVNLI